MLVNQKKVLRNQEILLEASNDLGTIYPKVINLRPYRDENINQDNITDGNTETGFEKEVLKRKSLKGSKENKRKSQKKNPRVQKACDICGKTYRCQRVLEEHLNVHKGIKPFACENCGDKFSRKSVREKHILYKHTNDKKAKCVKCGKGFIDNSKLKDHVNVVHKKIKNFLCQFCKKAFSCRGNLKKHLAKDHHADDLLE